MVSGDRVVLGGCWSAWYSSWWAGGVCGPRMWAAAVSAPSRPHRVPVDHVTCEVSVRGLHARVDDVHAYTCPSQIAVVIPPVDRAACAGRASDEGKKPRE